MKITTEQLRQIIKEELKKSQSDVKSSCVSEAIRRKIRKIMLERMK